MKDAERCLRFFPKFFDLINFWYFLKIKIYTQNLSIKFFKFQKFRKKHLEIVQFQKIYSFERIIVKARGARFLAGVKDGEGAFWAIFDG